MACITIDGWEIPLVYSTPWNGAAQGRTEPILRYSPRRDKRFLSNFFSQFTLADFIIHEIFRPPHGGGLGGALVYQNDQLDALLIWRVPSVRGWVGSGVWGGGGSTNVSKVFNHF